VSTEKFLVYFLLIAFYVVYSRFSDVPEHPPHPTVASIPADAPTAGSGAPSPAR
jgi:hypothetical protein